MSIINKKKMGIDFCKEIDPGIYGIIISLPDGGIAVVIPLQDSACVASGFGASEEEAIQAALSSRASLLEEGVVFCREEKIQISWEEKPFYC